MRPRFPVVAGVSSPGLLVACYSASNVYNLLSKQCVAHQKFLTWLSVLPGRRFAISDQRFPISDLALVIVASSALVHAPFLMLGSVSRFSMKSECEYELYKASKK